MHDVSLHLQLSRKLQSKSQDSAAEWGRGADSVAGNGSRSQQVSRPKIAATNSVMRDHLRQGPVPAPSHQAGRLQHTDLVGEAIMHGAEHQQ
jgi:hypothetical protein